MRENLRWVEEAEARQMRELAAVQHAAAEPRLAVASATGTPVLMRWLRTVIHGLPVPAIRWRQTPGRRRNGV